MFGQLIEFLERLTTQFTWARLGVLIGTLTTIGICLWVYESWTAHFRLDRLQREAALVERIAAMEQDSAYVRVPELRIARSRILTEIGDLVGQNRSAFTMSPRLKKALAAASPWLLLLLTMAITMKGAVPPNAVLGMVVLASPFVVLGAFLPDFNPTWINYVAYPILQFLAVVIAAGMWSKIRK